MEFIYYVGGVFIDNGQFYFINDKYFSDFPDPMLMKKYRNYYNSKIKKYGKCDNIVFGHILGHEKAFLIQNICPITPNYIEKIYINKNSKLPVRVESSLEKELIKKAKHILASCAKIRIFNLYARFCAFFDDAN